MPLSAPLCFDFLHILVGFGSFFTAIPTECYPAWAFPGSGNQSHGQVSFIQNYLPIDQQIIGERGLTSGFAFPAVDTESAGVPIPVNLIFSAVDFIIQAIVASSVFSRSNFRRMVPPNGFHAKARRICVVFIMFALHFRH